jgi:hypothetical protein
MLHQDAICKALWSQRNIAEKTLAELQEHRDGIGGLQWFTSYEDGVPVTSGARHSSAWSVGQRPPLRRPPNDDSARY